MKLAGFEVYRYGLPFSSPLVLKGATLHHREGFILKLFDDSGNEGRGEISPLPGFSREDLDEAGGQLGGLCRKTTGWELAAETTRSGGLARALERLEPAPSVRFGFELAVHNLYAAATGIQLPGLISDSPADTVSLNGLLSGPPEAVLDEAGRLREAGYRTVKLKVGGRPVEEEISLVRELNEVLGDDVKLRLDANRQWSLDKAGAFARGIKGIPLEYIEEPLADSSGLSSYAREYGVPVALDETLVGMPPEDLTDHGYARAIVLKPTLLGGISRTLQLARRAQDLGITPVLSSAFETGVGTLGLLALATGTGAGGAPAGLDTYRRLAEDVIRPPLDLGPRVEIPGMFAVRRGLAPARLVRAVL